jgi:hypothetical protein
LATAGDEDVTYPLVPGAELHSGAQVFAVTVPEQFLDPAESNADSVPSPETV